MTVTAILLAGGAGARMGADFNKVYLPLSGRPVLAWSMLTLARCPDITHLIITAAAGEEKEAARLAALYGEDKLAGIATGGKERSQSVAAALSCLPEDTSIVLIHDGARPLLAYEDLTAVLAGAKQAGYDGALLAEPVTDTIKEVTDLTVSRTLPRERLWRAQTPQVFKKDLLLAAYAQNTAATDDASLVEALGGRLLVVPARSCNLKLTTPLDLELAELLLSKRKTVKA